MFGVHTVIIKYPLNFEQAIAVLGYDRKHFNGEISKLKKNESRIFYLKAHPLVRKMDIVVTRIYNSSFVVYLRLQIAPQDFVVGTKTEAIFTSGMDKIAFYSGLNTLLDELFGEYPFISKDYTEWQVNYIEYSANLYSENVNLAIEMLRKNTKDVQMHYFKEAGDTVSISRKAKQKRNISTAMYIKSVAVQDLHREEYENLKSDTDGYIRFERQCGRSYLWNCIACQKQEYDNLDAYLSYFIAKRVLADGYAMKFAIGDFYSLKRMYMYIKDKKLVEYAESATKSRSIKCTKIKAKNGKSAISTATNNARIRAFDSEYVAPVAIPRRAKIDYLPNPIPNTWIHRDIGVKKITHDIENLVMSNSNG